jgi:ABC-type multidrug transport system ATPase subunit
LAALDQAVYPMLTCREHLKLAADLRGCEARDQELLEHVSLQDASEKLASHLSTGMRARLKIALAIQNDPDVLMMDEPGAGLDEAGRELVARITKAQAERGALILATNDPLERRLANLELSLS